MGYYYYFADDHIWFLRDIANKNYKSLFESPYLGFYKYLYEKYGNKVQINCFYETDEFYKSDYFNLSLMPDKYKDEWIANSNWLRLAFHARKEFPDYPYINASYVQVYNDYTTIRDELIRFAGEETFSNDIVVHWTPMSRNGCRALKDCGVRMMHYTTGSLIPRNKEADSLSPAHLERINQNRAPETHCVFCDDHGFAMPAGYNYLDKETSNSIRDACTGYFDPESGLIFKFMFNVILNSHTPDINAAKTRALAGKEFFGLGTHEQYFFPFYSNYESDYKERMEAGVREAAALHASPVFLNELPLQLINV